MSRGRLLWSCFCIFVVYVALLGISRHSPRFSLQLAKAQSQENDSVVPWPFWRNKQTSSLFGICTSAHRRGRTCVGTNLTEERILLEGIGYEEGIRPDTFPKDQQTVREIPQYILDYAPLVHLYSGEQFWPSDIAEHLTHVTPNLNYTPIQATSTNPNLTNLDKLNEYGWGRYVYLKSDDNVEERPDWLASKKNIPNAFGHENTRPFKNQKKNYQPGRSDAPAVLIVVNKGRGIVDAFWFYFYSYNLGNVVLNVRFGNHVGDWEHSLVRFQNGKPKVVFFSEHNFGSAYSYSAVEKIGQRPVVYSATGTHAMYAMPGAHPYILPLGLLHDQTDQGPLWDPLLNSHTYTYDHSSDTLRASNVTPHAPTQWFYFAGHWGDRFYPIDDDRQYEFAGQYHYVSGPLGPRFKNLGRRKVCQGRYSDPCVIKHWLGGGGEVKEYPGSGDGEDEGYEDDYLGTPRGPNDFDEL